MTGNLPARARPGPLALAVWFGLLAGFGELMLLAVRRFVLHRFLFIGRDVLWMAPAADVCIFAVVGLVFWAVSRLPQRPEVRPVATGVLAGLTMFTLLLMYGPLHRLAALLIAAGVGVQTARLVRPRLHLLNRLVRRTLPVGVAVVIGLGLGLHAYLWWVERRMAAERPQAQADAPNILLIVLDTVRSLDLSLYGYQRSTTPHLDEWARKGTIFLRALSAAPWTLPSHASIMTGHYPHDLSADWEAPLDGTYPTLAEVLETYGYRTGGFVGNIAYCSYETGIGRGFSRYQDYVINPTNLLLSSSLAKLSRRTKNLRYSGIRKQADLVNREFLTWLDEDTVKRPFFAFLNYFDAHGPYAPPPPYDRMFAGPGDGQRLQQDIRDIPAREWTPSMVQAARDAYDESIAYLDGQLSRVFDVLQQRGLADRTLVVLTADHGEEFGRHGQFYHGNTLYRAAVQVPLVFVWPGHIPEGLDVDSPVSLRDLGATILALALPAARPFPGRSLSRFWDGTFAADRPDTLLQEVNHAVGLPRDAPVSLGPMRAVVLNGLRLIRRGDGREELFDFDHDTAEGRDLSNQKGETAGLEELRAALDQLLLGERSGTLSSRRR